MMWTSRGGLPGPCRAQSLCASQPAVCRRSALPTALCPHTGLRHTPAPHTSSHLRSQHSRRPHRRAQAAETAADPSIAAADEMLDSEASTVGSQDAFEPDAARVLPRRAVRAVSIHTALCCLCLAHPRCCRQGPRWTCLRSSERGARQPSARQKTSQRHPGS